MPLPKHTITIWSGTLESYSSTYNVLESFIHLYCSANTSSTPWQYMGSSSSTNTAYKSFIYLNTTILLCKNIKHTMTITGIKFINIHSLQVVQSSKQYNIALQNHQTHFDNHQDHVHQHTHVADRSSTSKHHNIWGASPGTRFKFVDTVNSHITDWLLTRPSNYLIYTCTFLIIKAVYKRKYIYTNH